MSVPVRVPVAVPGTPGAGCTEPLRSPLRCRCPSPQSPALDAPSRHGAGAGAGVRLCSRPRTPSAGSTARRRPAGCPVGGGVPQQRAFWAFARRPAGRSSAVGGGEETAGGRGRPADWPAVRRAAPAALGAFAGRPGGSLGRPPGWTESSGPPRSPSRCRCPCACPRRPHEPPELEVSTDAGRPGRPGAAARPGPARGSCRAAPACPGSWPDIGAGHGPACGVARAVRAAAASVPVSVRVPVAVAASDGYTELPRKFQRVNWHRPAGSVDDSG